MVPPAPRLHSRMIALGALSALLIGSGALPAAAASPAALSVSVSADTASAETGTPADFTIGYQCVGAVACEDATITVPLPEFVDAATPEWGFVWWSAPVLTGSADVVSSEVSPEGTVTFVLNQSLAPGTTGTVGVRYTSTTLTTPQGVQLAVEATAVGSNADAVSGSASMRLDAPNKAVAANVSSGQLFNYLDRDLIVRTYVQVADAYATGVQGIGSVSAYSVTLPPGAQFVSSDPLPDSVSGDTLTWNDVPPPGTSNPALQRALDLVVQFPSALFNDGQNVTVTSLATGTFVDGSAFTTAGSAVLRLQTYVEKLEPYLQVLGDSWNYTGQVAARGAEYRWIYYLNNANSTAPAVSAVVSTDIDTNFDLSTISAPAGLTISWVTDSGATGSLTTTESTLVSLTDLGVPDNDKVIHLDVNYGAVAAPATTRFVLNGTTTDESVSQVRQCGALLMTAASGTTATSSGCGTYGIVDPYLAPSVTLQGPTDGGTYRPGSTIAWKVNLYNQTQGSRAWEPVLYFVVPAGTKAATEPVTWDASLCSPSDDYANPTVDIRTGALDGQDLLVISWPGAPAIAPGAGFSEICGLQINTTVTTAPAGTIDARLYGGDARGPISGPFSGYNSDSADSSPWAPLVGDDRSIVSGGTASTVLARSIASAATGAGASLQSQLTVKGSFDSDFVSPPQRGTTESGGAVDYKLPVRNTGNVALTDIVIYDVLPHVGDTGVSAGAAGQPRGSQFAPILSGPVTLPAGFQAQYSMSTNPCRPEVAPDVSDCVDDWTATPADFAMVRSLKFVQDAGVELAPGAEVDLIWSMGISQDVPAAQVAFNSAAFAATRADTGQILAAEPAPAGVETAVADLAVTIAGGELVHNSTSPLSVTVTNIGPSAEIVTVSITASNEFVLNTFEDTAGWVCIVSGDTATCASSAPLPPGSSVSVPLTVTTGEAGSSGQIRAAVSGPLPDPNLANNTATANFTVVDELTEPPVIAPGEGGTVRPDGNLAQTGGSFLGFVVTSGVLALLVGARLLAIRRRNSSRLGN